MGVWRLVSVKYSGQTISMESFIKYKKEQIEAMQAELKKPRSARDMSRSSHYGLTDRYDIDRLLRNTIAATDPVLQFVDEMMKHPSVGPKLASHLGDVYKTRWEEAKLGFVLTTIKQLEERKAADDALARGQLPELFAELRKLVTDLKIAELVEKNMDAELDTNNLKALMGWLWNSKRDLFSEGNMESDMTKGAAIVLRYLEAYRIVYDTRKETEELLGHSPASDHGRRILTGPGFLAGKIERGQGVGHPVVPVRPEDKGPRAEAAPGDQGRLHGHTVPRLGLRPGHPAGACLAAGLAGGVEQHLTRRTRRGRRCRCLRQRAQREGCRAC